MIFDTDGKLRATLGERHHPRFGLPFNHPTDVAVAPSGDIYVCDGYGNAHVHCFSATGEHLFRGAGSALARASSRRHTGFGSWPTAGCWSPTARTTACRSSPPTALISVRGASSITRWIFTAIPTGPSLSPTRRPYRRIFTAGRDSRPMQGGGDLQPRHLGRRRRQSVLVRAYRHNHQVGTAILAAPSGARLTLLP